MKKCSFCIVTTSFHFSLTGHNPKFINNNAHTEHATLEFKCPFVCHHKLKLDLPYHFVFFPKSKAIQRDSHCRELAIGYQFNCSKFTAITYVHNTIGNYNPSVRIMDLVSHTTYVVCINFIHKWWDLHFWKVFMAVLFTLRDFAKNLLKGNCQRNTFCILFWCLAWGSNPGSTFNKLTHYQLDCGDYIMTCL